MSSLFRDADPPRSLRWALRLLALGIGAVHTAVAIRSQSMNEDGIGYLDLGEAWWRADWDAVINITWSPLYAWIVGGVVHFTQPAIRWEFPVVQLANFAIYALALRRDVKNPFPPESDEVGKAEDKEADGKARAEAEDDKKDARAAAKDARDEDRPKTPVKPLAIDWDGLAQRVTRVPVPADNIDGLAVTRGFILFTRAGAPFYGRDSDRKTALHIFDVKKREASELLDDVQGYALSDDGQKALRILAKWQALREVATVLSAWSWRANHLGES